MGNGVNVDLDVVIQITDELSGGSLIGASVTVEGEAFTQDNSDKLLWKGKLSVPKDGGTFEIVVETIDKIIFTKNVTYFNKTNAIKPLVMGVNPGNYLLTYDPVAHRIAQINLADFTWSEYVRDSRLTGTDILFDFNSRFQHAYTMVDGSDAKNKRLVAAGIKTGFPAVFFAGSVYDPISITYDSKKERVLVLQRTEGQPEKLSAVGVATGTGKIDDALTGGFANGKLEADSFKPVTADLAWDIPAGTIKGPLKSFAYYRNGSMFLIADERTISGVKKTVIQAFTEGANGAAQFKFEVSVGPDISNITVNNGNSNGAVGGVAYVAENKSSLLAGKLKKIDLIKGEVSDLGEIKGNVTIANFTDLRFDNAYQKLYVGDSVADSIYEITINTNVLRELPIVQKIVDEPPPIDN